MWRDDKRAQESIPYDYGYTLRVGERQQYALIPPERSDYQVGRYASGLLSPVQVKLGADIEGLEVDEYMVETVRHVLAQGILDRLAGVRGE